MRTRREVVVSGYVQMLTGFRELSCLLEVIAIFLMLLYSSQNILKVMNEFSSGP